MLWIRGFSDVRIDDRKWLEDYKSKLHPDDDWTNINLEAYCRWLCVIDNNERRKLIDDAIKDGIVGFLE